MVGVGSDRPHVRIDILDLRAPKTIRPEDQFKAVVEVVGEGLPEQPANVTIDVSCVKWVKQTRGKDEKLEAEPVDLVIRQFDPKATKESKKTDPDRLINLTEHIADKKNKKVSMRLAEPVKFDKSTPPRAAVEFQIDAATLAKAAGLSDRDRARLAAWPKWEIVETTGGGEGREGTEIRLAARIPKDKLESFPFPEHTSQDFGLQVLRRPPQVLLFASSASREFQFLRTLMIREMDKDKAQLSIYVQPPPGSTEPREGIVHGIPQKRQLLKFPDKYDLPAADEDAKLLDLASYDVIVAFDPDWTQLTREELENVKKWVDRGGGLVAIGGPINTLQLARPGAHKEKLAPILDLYPVKLKDIRIDELDRKPDRPWPLLFTGALPEMHDFLKLSDELDRGDPGARFLSDWNDFFGYDKDKTSVQRGFFSYYPVEKPDGIVVARFGDLQAKDANSEPMPFLVVSREGQWQGRVVWIGSGEMWRLRQYKEIFHERFWTKLIRFAASSTQGGRSSNRMTLYMSRTHPANKPIRLDAKIFGKEGKLPDPKSHPEVVIKAPEGIDQAEVPRELVMKLKPGSQEYFETVFQIRTPGTYSLEVHHPETKDSVSQQFVITPSNPELDNIKPDFDLMYRLASPASLVMPRLDDGTKQELRRRLTRPHGVDTRPIERVEIKGGARETADDHIRLYFDLPSAGLIPSCMIADQKTTKNKGPIADYLWDDGFVLREAVPPQQPIKLSYVLLLGVGLLSVEWLTRKLLRLA